MDCTSLNANPVWETRMGNYAGNPIIIQCNRALERIAGDRRLKYQAAASVPVRSRNEDGLPGPEERPALDTIERRLSEALAETGLACYALRVHCEGTCDFIYYTGNKTGVRNAFDRLERELDEYAVAFSIKRDRTWVTYSWFSSWE